jgi:hypothetical protein
MKPVLKNGKSMIMVDCRINGCGERKYFATKTEAEGEQQRQRIKRATYHLAAHRNEALTQAMLGHESGKMHFARYRELVKPKDAERYWQIMPASEAGKVVAIAAA